LIELGADNGEPETDNGDVGEAFVRTWTG